MTSFGRPIMLTCVVSSNSFSGKLKKVTEKSSLSIKDKDDLLSPEVEATFKQIFAELQSTLSAVVDDEGECLS